MTINFDCKKCIHSPVCMFKNEAAEEISAFNNRIGENERFKLDLNCKYYGNISVTKDVIYCK